MNLGSETISPVEAQADLLVVPVIADEDSAMLSELSQVCGINIQENARAERFKGDAGKTFLIRNLPNLGTPRVLLVGLGKKGEREKDDILRAGATAMRQARDIFATRVALCVSSDASTTSQLVIGAYLGAYKFDRHVSRSDEDFPGFESLTLLGDVSGDLLDRSKNIAEGICLARDLFNETPNILTPEVMADKARVIGSTYGFETTILDETELVRRGFDLISAVGRGSDNPPRLIHLIYRPDGEVKRRLAFVGKGITFDTGGYNLKLGAAMLGMHGDMGGAAAVLGAAEAIGRIRPKGVEIHFVVPAAENSISGRAMRPQDIIRGYGKKTVEIHNTDAEGRLVLADALAYIQEHSVDTIIDLATLTGACVVALGEYTAGLFSNNDELANELLDVSQTCGEDMWRMPLTKKLDKGLDTPTADMKNIGPRWGGAITAALFLQRFVKNERWAHIDIAGPAWAEADTALSPPGGTGFGVATLVGFATKSGEG